MKKKIPIKDFLEDFDDTLTDPSEEELSKIRGWDLLNDDPRKLVEYVQSLWAWKDLVRIKGKKVLYIEMHTGGWSGNEEIMLALEENILFFPMFWEKSTKGGHYYFKIRPLKRDK